ncbi:hypothetical protein WA026_009986 [Henosepilachna vigintioctopunctata]|uniref:Glucose-methanol-choline oxidoreductase N-terminal domain-containing protein n=1 Tax=Henosepilachna vigintioctopunctata TaxID=420089 RepID=A0AAW1TLL7_9CUCU
MFIAVVFVLIPLVVNSCNVDSKLKVDYLEQLIDVSFKNAQYHKLRTDNSKFFKNQNTSDEVLEYGTFDFIVVGAGSAGSIVASRLSEVEKWKILLIEAGDYDDDLTKIPYIYRVLQLSERNWGYYTVSQKNGCFGSKNRQCPYITGKVLGGTGSVNGVAYVRGNSGDYDKWASLGNPGWSFENLLPYFKKMENFDTDDIDLNFRGFGGPLNVAYKEPKQDLSNLKSFSSDLKIKYLKDYNGEKQIGISRHQKNIDCGGRVSGATAYVRPSMQRHNFNLSVKSLVTKIIIDESTKTAEGVEFIRDGKKYRALAKKEVIISGGSVNSPQLLMLSGIGPEDELQKHKIPQIQILPVGKYLKDHYSFKVFYRKRMLTNLDNTLTYTFLNTKNESSTVPNLEFVLLGTTPVPKPIPQLSNYVEKIERFNEKINEQTDYSFEVYLLHPKSTGSIKLQSNDPIDFPLIDAAIFEDQEDLQLIYESTEIFKIFEQSSFARALNLSRLEFDFCDEYKRDSKPYWYCAIQYLADPVFHMSSTVKMGPRDDPFAVVDNKLRVYGVKNLRVADCSVMPSTISGHNNAAAFLIGEKAADLIKADHSITTTN